MNDEELFEYIVSTIQRAMDSVKEGTDVDSTAKGTAYEVFWAVKESENKVKGL